MIQHPTSGYVSKGNEITILRYLHSHVHCNIIHKSQEMETTQVYINWWMDKEDMVYINKCIYSQSNIIHPWERNLAICDSTYGAGSWRHYVKCNKTEKDKCSSPLNNVEVRGIDPICGWNRRRQWHSTPVLLPGKSHGQRSLVGCSPWGREESESDMTEWLHFHSSISCIGEGNGNPL